MKTKTHVVANSTMGDDLCKLAQLLVGAGVCKDVGPLDTAGKSFAKNIDGNNWSYKVPYLDFDIDSVGKILPTGSSDLKLRFSIDVKGHFLEKNLASDPFHELKFNIEISGVCCDPSLGKFCNIYCSWHLDRHVGKDTEETKYSHPFYHLTFGGDKMKEKEFDGTKLDFGNILVMPTPRIAYPPMDAILGIDFIIQNYLHKDTIKPLVSNPEYQEIIYKSQEYLWKPYYITIASKWEKDDPLTFDSSYSYNKLLPFLR